MKRHLQFAAGVLLIVVPVFALLTLAFDVAVRIYSERAYYKGMFVTVDVSLDETLGFVALLALSIAAFAMGIGMVRRSRNGGLALHERTLRHV